MDEELLGVELEALEATFPDELIVQRGQNCTDAAHVLEVLLPLAPRGCPAHHAFVTGRLRLGVTASYPDQPPTIALLDTKGIGDTRLARLHQVRRRGLTTCIGQREQAVGGAPADEPSRDSPGSRSASTSPPLRGRVSSWSHSSAPLPFAHAPGTHTHHSPSSQQ